MQKVLLGLTLSRRPLHIMAWFDPFGLGLFEACAGGSRPELPKATEGEPAQASNKPKTTGSNQANDVPGCSSVGHFRGWRTL